VRPFRTALVTTALLVALPLALAQAVAPFGAVVHITPTTCQQSVSSTSATGTTRGYYRCSTGSWRSFQGTGSSWTTGPTPYTASQRVLAVAVDGNRTWQVTTDSTGTWIRSRIGSTYYGGRRLTTALVDGGDAAVVAAGGLYYVVWSQGNGEGGAYLYEAHTLDGAVSSHRFYSTSNTNNREFEPSMAYQSATHKVVLAWTHSLSVSQNSVLMSSSSGGPWAAPKSVASDAFYPSMAVTGSRVAIGYTTYSGTCGCSGRVALGTTAGITGRHAVTGQVAGGLLVATSNGIIGAVWLSRISPYPIRIASYASGAWTERTLGSPYPQQLNDIGSAGGKLRVFAGYGYIGVRSQ
jgi:hypothetical protein